MGLSIADIQQIESRVQPAVGGTDNKDPWRRGLRHVDQEGEG